MPHVVNGIGTWYWGKDKLRTCRASCEFCGQIGDLRSYDTRTYFVVFYVPVIPLGRKRILDECPSCRKHKAVKYSVWQRALTRDVPEAVEALEAAPRDPQAARRALGLVLFFQDQTHLSRIAAACNGGFAGDQEVQLLLADAFEFFGRHAESEQVYRARLESDDRPDNRELLARNLLLQSRPDEAWDLLSHVLAERRSEGRGLLLLVAESYESWGMHDAALDVLHASAEAFPQLSGDGDYKRLHKAALKHKHTGKRIRSRNLTVMTSSSGPARAVASRVPMVIAASILIVAAGVFVLASMAAASRRTVYLVNGLSAPYEVVLNGQRTTVRPKAYRAVEIAEGDIDISVHGTGINISAQRCRVATNFFSRLFTDDVFVINPDRTALILWEETEYRVDPTTSSPNVQRFYCGDLLTAMQDIDYEFEEFPPSITLPGRNPARRTRVGHLGDMPPGTVLGILATRWDTEQIKAWVRRLAAIDADDAVTTSIVVSLLGPSESLPILDQLRSLRPLRAEAHRAYQQLKIGMGSGGQLVSEYRELLADSPDDPVLAYLLARLLPDHDEVERLLRRGLEASTPCPYSINALAFQRLADGDWLEALPLARRALAMDPDHPGFRWTHRLILEGLERFEDALADFRSDRIAGQSVDQELYLLARAKKTREIEGKLAQIASDYAESKEPQLGRRRVQALRAMLAYVDGDQNEMVRLADMADDPAMQFARATTAGDLDSAKAVLSDLRNDKAFATLLLSIVAAEGHNEAMAAELTAAALAAMATEEIDAQQAAGWLAGETAPDVNKALRVSLLPNHKVIVMLALARRFPQDRDQYLAMARKLNVDTRFPYLLVQKLTRG